MRKVLLFEAIAPPSAVMFSLSSVESGKADRDFLDLGLVAGRVSSLRVDIVQAEKLIYLSEF